MNGHIQDGELLRASDGELSRERAAEINEHLAACWVCRTRLHDLEGTIEEFVHVHLDEFEPVIPEIDGPRALLRARIAAVEEEEAQGWWKTSWNWGAMRRWSVPLYAVVAAIVIAILVLPSWERHVEKQEISAAEVYGRAQVRQQNELGRASQPVTYQKIRIQVAGHTYERTIYVDKRNARSVVHLENVADNSESERDSARVLVPVERAFSESNLDWQQPLSPSRLNNWRAALRVSSEHVRSEQSITEVSTTTPEGPISEVKVTFRNIDFHPISETLRLRDNNVVEVAELDYGIFELGQLRAGLFDRPTGPVITSAIDRVATKPAPVAGGLELELDVVQRLDRAKAFLGEQILIERHADGIAVRGVVDDPSRKQEILAALGPALANPAFKINLVVPGSSPAEPKKRGQVFVEGVEDLQSAPAEGQLRAFFGQKSGNGGTTDEAVQRYASEVSNHSQSARAHAFALKQIAEQFSPSELSEMTPEQHLQWRALIEMHASSVLTETGLMRENLEPVFRTNAEEKPPLVTSLGNDAELVDAAARLSDLAASNDSAVWHSFAASTQASKVTIVCLPEFWDSLLDAEALAREISVSSANGH